MLISDTPFVPTAEIRRVTSGSYEHLIGRLSDAVAKISSTLFGEDVATEVVGTFSGHALVLAKDGRCVRVQYEDAKSGLKISGFQQVALQTFSVKSEYLKDEARKAVDAFLKGAQVEAAERLGVVARLIEAQPSTPDEKLTEGVLALLKSERTWKMQYAERAPKFRTFLGESVVATIEANRTKARFSTLAEDAADLDTIHAVVVEALQSLAERVDLLREEVEKAFVQLQALTPHLAAIGESEVLTAVAAFTQDLINDLRSVHKVVVESSLQVGRTDCLGRIHDTVAEELHQYEVAARFVIDMTSSLAAATQ